MKNFLNKHAPNIFPSKENIPKSEAVSGPYDKFNSGNLEIFKAGSIFKNTDSRKRLIVLGHNKGVVEFTEQKIEYTEVKKDRIGKDGNYELDQNGANIVDITKEEKPFSFAPWKINEKDVKRVSMLEWKDFLISEGFLNPENQ